MAVSARASLRNAWRWVLDDQRAVRLVAVLVLGVDVALAAVHVVVMTLFDAPDVWRVDMDGSYAEAFQYLKYVWIIALLLICVRQTRNWWLAAWLPLFAFFLADDALQLHEIVGFWYYRQPWSFGLGPLGPQGFAELVVFAGIGILVAIPLFVAYRKADAETKWVFRVLAALVVVLMVFALVIDAAHSLVTDIRVLDRGVGLIEDFGEMLVLSAIVVFAFRLNVSGGSREFVPELREASGSARHAVHGV